MRRILAALLLVIVASARAGLSTATVTGSQSWNVDECLHTYTIDGTGLTNGQIVYVQLTFDGVIQNSHHALYIQKSSSGVVTNNLPQPVGPYSGWQYGLQTITKTVHVKWTNEDTGMSLGSCTDTTQWTYTTVAGTQGTDHTHYENIQIFAAGDICPGRDGLTLKLKETINPAQPGGIVKGTYVVALSIDGVPVKTWPAVNLASNTIPGPIPFSISQDGLSTTHGAFTYAWSINGVTVASGSKQCADEIIDNTISNTGTANDAASDTTTATNGDGSTTTGTTTSSDGTPGGGITGGGGGTSTTTSTTTVNHSTTTMSSITNQDIYADVYHADVDAGRTGSFTTPTFKDVDTTQDGGASNIQSKLSDVAAQRDTAISHFTTKLGTLSVSGLPTSFGSVSSINFGTLPVLNTTINCDLTSGPVGSKLSLIRLAIFWLMSVAFIFLYMQTIRRYM